MAIFKKLLRFVQKKKLFKEWSTEYIEFVKTKSLKAKTLSEIERHVFLLDKEFGELTLTEITPLHIAQLINQIIEKGHAVTAKRVLHRARDCFNLAILYGHINHNPATPIDAPVIQIRRKRMTYDEFLKLKDNTPPHSPWVPLLLDLALVTAQRRADLIKMQFSDVRNEHLHITQQKTGARIALPLDLRLDAANLELGGVIERCKKYGSVESDYLLRKSNGEPLSADYVSSLFGKIRTWAEIGGDSERPNPPTLHEIRSLSERMYREQGINTQILLGHKSRSMTDMYNDDRGLTKDAIKYLVL